MRAKKSVKKYFAILVLIIISGPFEQIFPKPFFKPETKYYGIGDWDEETLGNHRAVIRVNEKSDAVTIHIPWRRRDFSPHKKNIIMIDATTGKRIINLVLLDINREYGNILFQPQTVPGEYYIYYMPFTSTGSRAYPTVTYHEPEQTLDSKWLKAKSIDVKQDDDINVKNYPAAELIQFQSIDEFNSFYPMEIIATKSETESLKKKNSNKKYFLFPEDRSYPIRMTKDLPFRWIEKGMTNSFEGHCDRNEYYVFQIGLFAVNSSIEDIEINFSDLIGADHTSRISSTLLTCFNKEGMDCSNKKIVKSIHVEKGNVHALWFGVDIPQNIKSQKYTGTVEIIPKNMTGQKIEFILTITNEILADRGDSEPWRHSRLRWLNSQLAFDDELIPPYTPVNVNGHNVSCLGRTVKLNSAGLPENIQSHFSAEVTQLVEQGKEILASPISMIIEDENSNILSWKSRNLEFANEAEGAVYWNSRSTAGQFNIDCKAKLEFDGYADFKMTLTPGADINVNDIRLEIPMKNSIAKYMMGMGIRGGLRPKELSWKWEPNKNQDAIWIGDVNAGIQVSFRDENYIRPLNTNFYQLKPLNMPPSWSNEGKGGISFEEINDKTLLLKSYSGSRKIRAGEQLHFYFSLLMTPFKTLDTKSHWIDRYYHGYDHLDDIKSKGANIVNVHHATEINPFINYPFMRPKEMKAYVDKAHKKGLRIKIYYTVRELSNIAPELFALMSLGDEIFAKGEGGGFSWLQEHLDQNYIKGWLVDSIKDAAIINSGVSRWHNYYVEGLDWLTKNVSIDGLYLDDVAFDRTTMKRVRKVLDRNRPAALIDLHSANQFNPRDGFANSANLYLEHFPYIDRLWFGEYFDYHSQPDFWLIEVSGIPFGLMGEMLQDGGNPWRGMIYGMTSRLPWAGDPTPIWKVWDDFGIKESQMVGYWVEDNPVKTDNDKVLATIYKKEKSILISLASWDEHLSFVKLTIDWEKLGLDKNNISMEAPDIKDFQSQAKFGINEKIPVEAGKGWLLIMKGMAQ